MAGRLVQSLRKYLITGIFVSLPLVITLYVLWFVLSFLDNVFGRFVSWVWGRTVPGAGTALTVVLLLLVGMFGANVIGRRLIAFGERILLTIPFVRTIYHSVKQVIEAFSLQQGGSFRRVVMVEYPRPGLYALAFVTAEQVPDLLEGDKGKLLAVFIPTTPNPTSGFVLLVPEDEVVPVELSVEQAFKMVISGGILSPNGPAKPAGSGAEGDGHVAAPAVR